MSEERGSISGLTGGEAREFHGLFMTGFIAFTVIAIIAHFLVWQWRPWFPGPEGYSAVMDGIRMATDQIGSLLS